MNTPGWVLLLGAVAYVAIVVMVLTIRRIAKRREDATRPMIAAHLARWVTGPRPSRRFRPVEASSPWLAQRALELRGLLRAQGVAIALADPADPQADWIIEASAGVAGLHGRALAAGEAGPRTAIAELLAAAGAPPQIATVRIRRAGVVLGEIAAATDRPEGFSRRDRDFLERFAAMLAAHLEAGELSATHDRHGSSTA